MHHRLNRRRFLKTAAAVTLTRFAISGGRAAAAQVRPNLGGVLAWNPDGTELALASDNGLFIYDRDFQWLRYREQQNRYLLDFGGWSPDGTKLLLKNQILSADTLDVELEFEYEFISSGWLVNGAQIFGLYNFEDIYILDSSDGHLVKSIPLTVGLEKLTVSPDGTRISSSVANMLFIFDAVQGELEALYTLPVNIISHAWSPDSAYIAYSAGFEVPIGSPNSIRTSNPDSASSYSFNILDVATGETLLTSEPAITTGYALTWNASTSLVAGITHVGYDHSYIIWDATTAEMVNKFPTPGQFSGNIVFSPDGTQLIRSGEGGPFVTPVPPSNE